MKTLVILEDKEVTVDFNIIPGEKGCISGPADNWHPPSEPEVEVESMVDEEGNECMRLYDKYQPEVDLACIEHWEAE